MSNSNEILLTKLNANISKLTELINLHKLVKINKPCFDTSLFKLSLSRLSYQNYLAEIEANYQKLVNLINNNIANQYIQQINYLAELLSNQIEAMNRELTTVKSKEHHTNHTKETVTTYEKYNQHLDYLRRLETMKYDLEQNKTDNSEKVIVINQRIERCKQAIIDLELQIESN